MDSHAVHETSWPNFVQGITPLPKQVNCFAVLIAVPEQVILTSKLKLNCPKQAEDIPCLPLRIRTSQPVQDMPLG